MSEPENRPDEVIEALVRRSLERDAEPIDPRPVFDRLQAARPELSESAREHWAEPRRPVVAASERARGPGDFPPPRRCS